MTTITTAFNNLVKVFKTYCKNAGLIAKNYGVECKEMLDKIVTDKNAFMRLDLVLLALGDEIGRTTTRLILIPSNI